MLVLLTLVVYIPAMCSGFIWDDDRFLWQNPLIHAGDGLRRFWFSTEAPDYFPLTSSMLWIEWRLFGMKAAGYHFVNVLLHAASALVLWRVLDRLKVPAAWLIAAVFVTHPVNVESVAWITERKNTLSFLLFISSIYFWIRHEGGGAKRWYIFSLLAFVLAMLSKTSVVPLPVVLLLMAWWRNARISRRDIVRILPFFACAIILSLVTIWFQYQVNIKHEIIRDESLVERTAGAAWAVWFYLYKALFPINLSFVYPQWRINTSSIVAWVPSITLIGLLGLLFIRRNTWTRAPLFALGATIALLMPVLGFLDIYFMRYAPVADHWQYVALPVVIAFVIGGAASLARNRLQSQAQAVIAALLLIVLSALSWRAQAPYKNEETLWRETLRINPAAYLAWNNLGVILEREGNIAEAASHYSQAIEHYPLYREAWFSLGNARASQARHAEAISCYQRAVAIDPHYVKAWNNLGNSLKESGQAEAALNAFDHALALQPSYPDALSNKASALTGLNRVDEAIALLDQALALEPEHASAHANLGVAHATRNEWKPAIEHLTIASRLDAENAAIQFNLATAHELAGDMVSASEHYRDATRINPRLIPAWLSAAQAYHSAGNREAALETLTAAAKANPHSAEIRQALAELAREP